MISVILLKKIVSCEFIFNFTVHMYVVLKGLFIGNLLSKIWSFRRDRLKGTGRKEFVDSANINLIIVEFFAVSAILKERFSHG